MGKLNQKTTAVLQLMRQHADPDGFLDWDKLDQEVPGWLDHFPSRRYVDNTASRLRVTGRFASEKLAASANGEHAIKDNPAAAKLTDKQREVYDCVKGYVQADGDIDWPRLFQEHPEWSKIMCFNKKDKHHLRGSQILTRLRQLKLLPEKQGSTGGKRPASVPAVQNGHAEHSAAATAMTPKDIVKLVEPAIQEVLGDMRFCSRCGKDVAPQLQAAWMQAKQRLLHA